MTVQHKNISTENLHEPKYIASSTTGDSGKVVTPNSGGSGTGSLRYLNSEEVNYNNGTSGLAATNTKDAIDEIVAQPNVSIGSKNIDNNSTLISVSAASDSSFHSASDFTEVTGIYNSDKISPQQMTSNNNDLQISISGIYSLTLWANITSTAASTQVGINYGVNGLASTSLPVVDMLVNTGTRYNLSATSLVNLSSNDTVSLFLAADKSADLTLTSASYSLTLVSSA